MDLLSPTHLLIIFLVALLLFGSRRIPELGKGIGEGLRALKDGMKEKPTEDQAATNATPTPPSNTEVKS